MDKRKLLSRLQAIETYIDCLNKELRELRQLIDTDKPVRQISPKRMRAKMQAAAVKANWEREVEAGRYKWSLQKEFNLKVPPSAKRVMEYSRTQNPSVFDGLMRN